MSVAVAERPIELALARGVRACVTTRVLEGRSAGPYARFNLGEHVGDDADAVAANRRALRALARLPASPRFLRQAHGTAIVELDGREAGPEVSEADAAVTCTRGVVLAVLTADCLPVLVADAAGTVVAAIHAGWRGLAAGIVERAVARVAALAGHDAALHAYVGPAISRSRYEVGAEVRDALLAADAAATAAFEATRPGHWLCDLPLLAGRRLARAGVARITQSGICTHTDPRFYSHRRDGVTGRFASLIWLEPESP